MDALLDHLLNHVFVPCLAGNPRIVESIGRFDGSLRFDRADLLFTLPDLYRFAVANFQCSTASHAQSALPGPDYKSFRRALYHGNMNTTLQALGAVVVVERADSDHALSVYRLTRCVA